MLHTMTSIYIPASVNLQNFEQKRIVFLLYSMSDIVLFWSYNITSCCRCLCFFFFRKRQWEFTSYAFCCCFLIKRRAIYQLFSSVTIFHYIEKWNSSDISIREWVLFYFTFFIANEMFASAELFFFFLVESIEAESVYEKVTRLYLLSHSRALEWF